MQITHFLRWLWTVKRRHIDFSSRIICPTTLSFFNTLQANKETTIKPILSKQKVKNLYSIFSVPTAIFLPLMDYIYLVRSTYEILLGITSRARKRVIIHIKSKGIGEHGSQDWLMQRNFLIFSFNCRINIHFQKTFWRLWKEWILCRICTSYINNQGFVNHLIP